MSEERSIIELTVPADDVDEAVERVCAEWGVARESVQVDVSGAPGAGADRSLVRISLMAPETDMDQDMDQEMDQDMDQDRMPGADPELEKAQTVLETLLEHMHLQAEVVASRGEPETENDSPVMLLDVRGDDLDPLIGRQGETVAALQYIVRLILSKEFAHSVDVVVDVQGHKQRREEQLRRMARRMAEQAAERQRVMTLEPMPANERRLIHLELRDHPDVTTESVGEGTHRKVTIVPRQKTASS
ncbi:MAG: R3H domain-containing nucleic acid-binding protein [Anaerolineales bacterium]